MSGIVHVSSAQVMWQEAAYRRKDGPLGLRNLGNTCYLNSVLQCLTYTPPLANLCLRGLHSSSCNFRNGKNSSSCPFCFLEKRIAKSLTIEALVDAPTKFFQNCLQHFSKHFRIGRQEDAHELLRHAIEACNNACVQLQKPVSVNSREIKHGDGKSKEEPYTVMKEIFGGILQSQVKCLTCGTESNKLDEIMDLSLDIMRLGSVREAMCRFFQPEVLDGDNKYQCSKCKKLSAARKQMSVLKAPNVLVIQLKRFENISGGKLDRYIAFEERLGLAGHMCRNSKDARPDYSLYGVVVHAGHSQDGGHYYAYVKEPRGKWYCCDDASVYSVSAQSVLAEKSYILFYLRSNIRPDLSPVSCNDSTPSPPTTPDTDLQEPPKKYSSLPSGQPIKPSDSNVTINGGTPKKQVRFTVMRNGGHRHEKVGREDHSNKRNCEVSGTPITVGGCASKQQGDIAVDHENQPSLVSRCTLDAASCATSDPTRSKLASREKLTDHRTLPSLVGYQSHSGTDQCGSGVLRGIQNTIGKRSHTTDKCGSEAGGAGHVGGDSTRTVQDKPIVSGPVIAVDCVMASSKKTLDAPGKRQREDGHNPALKVKGDARPQLLLKTIIKTAPEQGGKTFLSDNGSGIDRIQLFGRLEEGTRDTLVREGWCNNVRELLRAEKKRRILEGSWPKFATDRAALSPQLFGELREFHREKVPQLLKERLVEQLKSYFLSAK